jgi:hypothetical protein
MQRPLSIKDYVRATSRSFTLAITDDETHTASDCEVTEFYKMPRPGEWASTAILSQREIARSQFNSDRFAVQTTRE